MMRDVYPIRLGTCLVLSFALAFSPLWVVPDVKASSRESAGQAALRDLIRQGLEGNQELAAMRKEVEAAEAMLRQSRLLRNPTLEVRRARDRDGMGETTMLGASVPLELAGTRGARIRIAEAELMIRRQAVRARELTLAFEIGVAYVEVASANNKLANLKRRQTFAEQVFQITLRAVREGKKASVEETLESVELNRLRAMVEESSAALEEKRNLLRNLLGADPSAALPSIETIPEVGEVFGDVENLVNRGLAQRPELQGARAIELLSEARLQSARAEGRPQTELMAGYEASSLRFGAFGIDPAGMPKSLDKEMRMFSFGLKINIPVADRNQGAVAAARAEAESARQRRLFGETTIRREIASASIRVASAQRRFQILSVGVLEQSRRNLEIIRESYELGGRSLTEYLGEQAKLIEVENEYVDAEAALAVARLELLRAIGSEELVK